MVLLNKGQDQQQQQQQQPKVPMTGSSTTSELGLTVSNGNQMVGQTVVPTTTTGLVAPSTSVGGFQPQQHPQQLQQQGHLVLSSSGSGSPTMLPHPATAAGFVPQQQQYVVVSGAHPAGVQPVLHGAPPQQVVYVQQPQQQQGSHPGSGMTTPSMSMSANQGVNLMAPPPPASFSGSGSTGLVPAQQQMMIPTVVGTPAAFLPAQQQAQPIIMQQQQSLTSSGAPSPNGIPAATPPPGVSADPNDNGPKQLIVNYIPTQVTELELRSLFEQHGAVECARVIYDKNTGVSKGYGFVYYFSSQHAAAALKEMQGFELYGKPIRVGYAVPQRPLSSLSPYGAGGGSSRGPSSP